MNRSLGSITAAILVVLLAGCGQKSAPPVAGSAPSAGPTAPVTASPSGGNIYGPGGTPPASGPTGTGKDAPVL
ncbi:MAG: lipoprotein, partial [Mycobacterium leprae]